MSRSTPTQRSSRDDGERRQRRDASVAEQLIGDLLENDEVTGDDAVREGQGEPGALGHERATVYGDAAYGTGELQSA